ncbi:Survival of motor neuron--splicing factor 30 [Cichlidogyrus casuarinus]|uniref:Survival of motor neuron--splicing factor 30 n=1 Tax=Cichlidogyrus casuarinus TaxID=1844966 RepID=A0ABD2QCK6_9PLAT
MDAEQNVELDLQQNKLQLQAVEAQLEADPDNQELLDLKQSLEELIELTSELLPKKSSDKREWKKDDFCMAMYPSDKLFYKAQIIQLLADGLVAVRFLDYDRMETCEIGKLKPLAAPIERSKPVTKKNRVEDRNKKLEKRAAKTQKRKEKNEAIERLCEKGKNDWLKFNKQKGNKIKSKKSIFASPENIQGRVGVGTCGTAGKPMTQYSFNYSYLKK